LSRSAGTRLFNLGDHRLTPPHDFDVFIGEVGFQDRVGRDGQPEELLAGRLALLEVVAAQLLERRGDFFFRPLFGAKAEVDLADVGAGNGQLAVLSSPGRWTIAR